MKTIARTPIEEVLDLLDLEKIEENIFRGQSPEDRMQRVFGGQVLGQALVAASRTVEGRVCHSFHAYFLRAGDPKILTCDIVEGHLSSTLPHLANIAYLTKRSLTFDGKSETFANDKEADKLLTRDYRKGFEISDKAGTNNN